MLVTVQSSIPQEADDGHELVIAISIYPCDRGEVGVL